MPPVKLASGKFGETIIVLSSEAENTGFPPPAPPAPPCPCFLFSGRETLPAEPLPPAEPFPGAVPQEKEA